MIKFGQISGRRGLATATALAASSLLLMAFAPAVGVSAAPHSAPGGRAASGAQVTTPSWHVQNPPAPPDTVLSEFTGVSCAGVTPCIAVGLEETDSSLNTAFAERWNGSAWSLLTVPNAPQTHLDGVDCVSRTFCVAVGAGVPANPSETEPLAEVWNGTTWTAQATITPAGTKQASLTSVSCRSATQCTAVGWYERNKNNQLLLAERWNGSVWRTQTVPAPSGTTKNQLNTVSCASATSCVAVGSQSAPNNAMVAEVWNGTTWTVQSPSEPSDGSLGLLNGVSCTAATACTAVGTYLSSGDEISLVEFWNGSSWTQQSVPNPAGANATGLGGVSCASAGLCVAVGGTNASGQSGFAEIWDGSAWTLSDTGQPSRAEQSTLNAVSCPTVSNCTAVGSWAASEQGELVPFAAQYS